jgi:hypothetical protein
VFRLPEVRFAGVSKDLRDFASFVLFDAVVEVFKEPIQPLPQGAAYAAFPGAHEADQKENGGPRLCDRSLGPRTSTFPGIAFGARTLLQKSASQLPAPSHVVVWLEAGS